MASHLTLVPAFGAAPGKQVAPAVNKPEVRDDRFAKLVESTPAETKPADNAPAPKAAESAAPDTARAEVPNEATSDASAAETVAETAAVEVEAAEGDETGKSLSDALLEALTAVVSATEQQGEDSPLAEIEDALGQLADAMGIDMASLIQQIQKLAEAAGLSGAAQGEADGELVAKLTDFLAKALGTDSEGLDPEIQANLTRLVDAAKKFVQLPTEPDLAEPMLKTSEPVLTGKAEAGADKAKEGVSEKDPSQRVAAESAIRSERPAGTEAGRPAPNPAAIAEALDGAQPAIAQQGQGESFKLPMDSSAAVPRVMQAGYQTSQQQINLPQIAFEMARQVDGGNTRFQIRLDPPELGRIDVKLDIDANGQVNARLTVEKAETLDLMQRDQRALERALQQAGLDANKTNLEFSLKQNPFAGDQNDRPGRESGMAETDEAGSEDSQSAPAVTLYRGSLQASGLNIIA